MRSSRTDRCTVGSQRLSHRTGRLLAGSHCATPSGALKVHTTGWLLTGREGEVTLWGHGLGGRAGAATVQGLTPGTGGRDGWVGAEYLLKPGLMRDSPGHRLLTPSPGPPL